MKHIKLFENFKDSASFSELEKELRKYGIKNYTINSDETIDVDGNVNLRRGKCRDMTKLPFKFGRITGDFDCSYNKFTSLEGSPKYVGGDFNCSDNKLTTLEGMPLEIGGGFYCEDNKLTTLEGMPFKIGGDFDFSNNKLTTLEGMPLEVGGDFNCCANNITSLKGSPREVVGDFHCHGNKLTSLEGMPLEIGGDFDCHDNKNLKELYSLSNIEGIIYCDKHIDISKFEGYCKEIDNS